ncbi:MAG: hypothetical protein U0517_04170 [Candidatus Andersenbacteria bacterium]
MNFLQSTLTADQLFKSLSQEGVLVTPVLRPEARELLAIEAETYHYTWAAPEMGLRRVKQRMAAVARLPQKSFFWELHAQFEAWLQAFAAARPQEPFEQPFVLNTVRLQRYPPGEIGIEPHKDPSNLRNLIAIFMLKGSATVGVCDDTDRTNLRTFEPKPGDLILLRAPGLFGRNYRPYHFVENITEERLVCTMCCKQSETD